MRFNTLARHNDRLRWHRWFAWHPVYLDDVGQTAWLESVWRRGSITAGWGEEWMDWEFCANPDSPTGKAHDTHRSEG